MASRKRVGQILHHDYRTLGKLLQQSVEHPVKPVEVTKADAPVQEVIHLASEPDFDIRNYCQLSRTRKKTPDLTSRWSRPRLDPENHE